MSKVDDLFKEATKRLNFNAQSDRVVGAFVRHRAEQLVAQRPAADILDLTVELLAEEAVIMGFATGVAIKLLQGPDDVLPPHFRLDNVSDVYSTTNQYSAAIKANLKAQYQILRKNWIWQIVWRAMTIHGDQLWKSHAPLHELEVAALTTLVDHRLRAVETMHYLVNTGGVAASLFNRSWSVAGAVGPWTDGYRTRVVEYPGLPKEPFEDVVSDLPTSEWSIGDSRIDYQDPHSTPKNLPMRLPSSIASAWKLSGTGGTLWVLYKKLSAGDPVGTLEKMFEIPRENYLERSLLYCDMVGSATQLAALAHSRRRRGIVPDTKLKDAMNQETGYAAFGPVLQPAHFNPVTQAYDLVVDFDSLMADGPNDPFFENVLVSVDDLQVGDFVLFWNSRIYLQLESGAWGNEFSFVMDVDPDPLTGRIPVGSDGPRIQVSGHGLATMSYGAMAADLVARFDGPFGSLARQRGRVFAAGSSTTLPPGGPLQPTLVKWEPYDTFNAPGAWWIRLTRDVWNTVWGYATLADAMAGIPRTVAHDPGGGSGYKPPPDVDAIYFPLWEPRVAQKDSDGDSWRAYLRKRRTEPAFRAPPDLVPLTIDKNLAVGIFYRGSKNKIPVVRPRIIK